MGGCVSSPKDLALNEGEAPVETPTSPKNAEGETVAQENNQAQAQAQAQEAGETKEEPLVDPTKAKEEKVEAKAEEAKVATETKEAEKKEAKAEQPKAEEKKEEPLVTL